jgi:hypothetical protein
VREGHGWSDEARVMTRPAQTYADLLARPAPTTTAALARGPFRMALAIGAGVAFLNGAHLGPARLVPAVACWSFVPLLRLAGLALAARVLAGRGRTTARVIDLYGAGQGPWYVWILGVSLAAVLFPDWRPSVFSLWPGNLAFALILCAVIAWSIVVRLAFFRTAFGFSPGRARLAVMLMEAVFGGAIVGYWLLSGQLLPRIL